MQEDRTPTLDLSATDRRAVRELVAQMDAAADAAESPDVGAYWRTLAHGVRLDVLA